MPSIPVDIAIIGSGAGGGTVAATLAPLVAQGKRIVLFEKGPRFQDTDFTGQELEMAQRLYADEGGFLVADRSITLAFAEGLGGSTLVYTGTSLLPLQRVIDSWQLEGIKHSDLCERAERFKAANHVHFLPEEEINTNNSLFESGCRQLGWQAKQFPVNVKGCKGSSLCNLGCPNGAKQGTAKVQLPMAEAAGVEVVTQAEIWKIADHRLEVRVHKGSEWEPGTYQVSAHTIVVSAGAVHSPALLIRSGYEHHLPALGRYWTCHPAHILVAEHAQPLLNSVGHPKSFMWDEHLESDHFFLETCMYFPFTTAKNLSGFGPSHEAFMQVYDRLQMILVLACDTAHLNQRVDLDRQGHPIVYYKLTSDTLQSLVKGTQAAAQIFFAAGAQRVHAPSARPHLLTHEDKHFIDERIQTSHFLPGSVPVSAAHLMGGCRMGRSAIDSVTNSNGQVHGIPWLYVADASLFPTALEINPYLTIMALAERVAEAVIEREKAA